MTEMRIEMATMFEAAVRAAIQSSGLSYTQLAKEAKVDGTSLGRFMNGERGLNSETLGRILDTLGCTLTPVINRFAPKSVGRPRKCVYRGKVWEGHLDEEREGRFYLDPAGDVLEIKEEDGTAGESK
jgi:transcriptional regulator with XRE-family HTH domain